MEEKTIFEFVSGLIQPMHEKRVFFDGTLVEKLLVYQHGFRLGSMYYPYDQFGPGWTQIDTSVFKRVKVTK